MSGLDPRQHRIMQREAFDLPIEGGKGFPDGGNSEIRQTSDEIGQTHTGFVGWHDLGPPAEPAKWATSGRQATRVGTFSPSFVIALGVVFWLVFSASAFVGGS